MADVKQEFDTSTAFTVTLASLASSATVGRESTVVDNSTTRFLDALVQLSIKLQAGTPAGAKAVFIYVYGSEDGTRYPDPVTGADAAITLRVPTNLRRLGFIACPDAGGLTYHSSPMSVAAAFGGVMPRKWGIVVRNETAVAFSATEGDHIKKYSGVYTTVI
jgi:hypothetical protein